MSSSNWIISPEIGMKMKKSLSFTTSFFLEASLTANSRKSLKACHIYLPTPSYLNKKNKITAIWVFPKIGVPQNGWFAMETLLKWMIWRYHYLRKLYIYLPFIETAYLNKKPLLKDIRRTKKGLLPTPGPPIRCFFSRRNKLMCDLKKPGCSEGNRHSLAYSILFPKVFMWVMTSWSNCLKSEQIGRVKPFSNC